MALAVKPFEQDTCYMVDIGVTSFRIIRYGVIVEIPTYSSLGSTKHLAFPKNIPATTCPITEIPYANIEFLATGSPFNLKVPFLGFMPIRMLHIPPFSDIMI